MYIIDRFEGDWAVVETEKRTTFNLPRSILPADLKEGDVINILVSINKEATSQRSKTAKNLLDDFFEA